MLFATTRLSLILFGLSLMLKYKDVAGLGRQRLHLGGVDPDECGVTVRCGKSHEGMAVDDQLEHGI